MVLATSRQSFAFCCLGEFFPPLIGFQERKNRFRHLVVLDVTSAQFVGNIDGHVARPHTEIAVTVGQLRAGALGLAISRLRASWRA